MLHCFWIGDDLGKLIDNVLREIRHSLQVSLIRNLLKLEFYSLRKGKLLTADLARLVHRFEYLIAALLGFLSVLEGFVTIRAPDYACNKRRFRKGELRHVLAEINIRCFAYAIDRDAGLLAEIDLVSVQGEDLPLCEPCFKDH